MAKCVICGKNMGFLATSSKCDTCHSAEKAAAERQQAKARAEAEQEQAKRDEQRQLALQNLNRQKDELFTTKVEQIKKRTQNGEKIFLYDNIYIPVDSIVNQESLLSSGFTLGSLKRLGFEGWEVVGVIPRTFAMGLTNRLIGPTPGSSPETWGAGLGGNVMGVHLIMKLDAAQSSLSDDFLLDYVTRNLADLLTESESQMLSALMAEATE